MSERKPWIGVDLDGTLAHYDNQGDHEIGAPIPLMMARVKKWVSEGATVKIFTARAAYPCAITPVRQWLMKHGLGQLEITNAKDYDMLTLWDDRAIQVEFNTGRCVAGS